MGSGGKMSKSARKMTCMKDPFFEGNLAVINSLNQRSDRVFSLVDLVRAKTVSLDLAGELAFAMLCGANLITAAGPSGAGKTTAMAALLGLVPPGARISAIASRADLDHPADGSGLVYTVVHEISKADVYGYLWDDAVGRFFNRIGANSRVASNLHADTMDEALSQLEGAPLNVARKKLLRVDIWLFLAAARIRANARRKVVSTWTGGEDFVEVWQLESSEGTQVRRVDNPALKRLGRTSGFDRLGIAKRVKTLSEKIAALAADGICAIGDVRGEILKVWTA